MCTGTKLAYHKDKNSANEIKIYTISLTLDIDDIFTGTQCYEFSRLDGDNCDLNMA